MDSIPGLATRLHAAVSGDAAAASGLEIAASVLWSRVLRFDAADPGWADRDRFVPSSGRFQPLLDAVLCLTGMAPPLPDCRFGDHPAMETAAGPPGQGFATAVGLALSERVLAGRFGRTLVDHRTWVLACETDLAAGVALEAAELAGRIGLDKLAVLFEPSGVDAADRPDAITRFAASGWAVRRVDATDPDAVAAVIARTLRTHRPTLIACHRPRLGADSRDARDIPGDWADAGTRGAPARRAWLKRLARHRLQPEFERQLAGTPPDGWRHTWRQDWLPATDGPPPATLDAGRQGLATLCTVLPEAAILHAIAGQAIAELATQTSRMPGQAQRHLACGVQEHGMAALANGMSLHRGVRPIVAASVISIDRMRPALRMAALMAQPVIYLLADEGADHRLPARGGATGAGWPPVEQFASLRAMPRVALFRPSGPAELGACWSLALQRTEGPSLIALYDTDAALPPGLDASLQHEGTAQGGYVLEEADGPRRATLIATGPDVGAALAARRLLRERGIETAVVSLPCWELFADQSAAYHAGVLGSALRIGIEAASGFGWERWIGQDGVFIGMDGFGPGRHHPALAPAMTADRIAALVARRRGATP
jgi:transketolase